MKNDIWDIIMVKIKKDRRLNKIEKAFLRPVTSIDELRVCNDVWERAKIRERCYEVFVPK